MWEIFVILLLLYSGMLVASCAGFDSWISAPLGVLISAAMLTNVTTCLVIFGLPTNYGISLGTVACLSLLTWGLGMRRLPTLPNVLFASALAIVVCLITHRVHLVKVSPDSFNYLNTAALLSSDQMEHAAPNWLQLRALGVPSLHAPANHTGAYYLRSITPLLALSTVLTLSWLCLRWCREEHSGMFSVSLSVMVGLLLLSHQRFAYHAFLINGHIFFAAMLLVIVGGSWMLANDLTQQRRGILLLQCICIPTLIVLRPDGAIFAGLALIPSFVSSKFLALHRASLLGVLGLGVAIWHAYLWHRYALVGDYIPSTVTGMVGLGLICLLAVPILYWQPNAPWMPWALPTIEVGLWSAVALLGLRDLPALRESVRATFHNVILDAGGWGISLKLIALIVLVLVLISEGENRVFLRYVVTTFLPTCLVLGFLRDLPYRVGSGDSLNRMFVHILPLAVLLIGSCSHSIRFSKLGALIARRYAQ